MYLGTVALLLAAGIACGQSRPSSAPLESSTPAPQRAPRPGDTSQVSTTPGAVPAQRAAGVLSLLPPPTPEGLKGIATQAAAVSEAVEPLDDKFREAVLKCQQAAFLTGKWGCMGNLVEEAGPTQVLRAVMELIESGDIDSSIDTHNIAHNVGRQTARVLWLNGEAFLRCSIEFNYGCQHGFFEHALANSPNATEAATTICADLVEAYSEKTVFYCYHGVGHGVMMASAYDLALALNTCDALGDAVASDGCWQGVFMENTNAVMRGEAREGVFSETDPLAPCNGVQDRHKWECYINHAGRLITFFDFSVSQASHACLDASPGYVLACIQSLGLMVSNSAWQLPLVGSRSRDHNVEVTLELCGQFPADYLRECIIGAVDNVMNFDGVVLDRALRLCRAADEPHQSTCFYRIRLSIGIQLIDIQQRYELCQQVDESYQGACLEGARVGVVNGQAVARQATEVQDTPAPSGPAVSGQEVAPAVSVDGCGPAGDPVEAKVDARFVDGALHPGSVTIVVGEAVRWVNDGADFIVWPASGVHPTHQLYPCFDARKPIAPGGSWTFTFDQPGVWDYHDHLNPRTKGVVVVESN